MSVLLAIGGEEIEVKAPDVVLDCVARRYGPFVKAQSKTNEQGPIVIEVKGGTENFPSFIDPSPNARLRVAGSNEITIRGAISGRYDISACRGVIQNARSLGDVDTMLRLALSVAMPLRDGLLLHGAALNNPLFGAVALCGSSGTGKSTAASALGAACDDLIVLRPENGTVFLCSTPYWHGVPMCAPCRSVVCLERGSEPVFAQRRGAESVRHLARHVVRYVSFAPAELAIFRLLSLVCNQTRVMIAKCPEGEAYIPYLSGNLGQTLRAAA